MSSRLSGAIEELEVELDEQLDQVEATKKLINSLLKRMGESPRYEETSGARSGPVRADEYYGKTVTGAAQLVLGRAMKALTSEAIANALETGGFDFEAIGWRKAGYVRNVAISLAKNPNSFHKLPNGSWGLPDWYPGVIQHRKAKVEKDQSPAPEIAEDEEIPEVSS